MRPLGCFYWGAVWTLAAWCETRGAFRSFRIDRIDDLQVLASVFRDEPGKTLADLFRASLADAIGPDLTADRYVDHARLVEAIRARVPDLAATEAAAFLEAPRSP